MSCGGCGCNPCSCGCECDPANESVASQLTNFETAFFGSITKSCVNGEVVWSLPCDLDAGIPGFPRLPGEGIACYLLRVVPLLPAGALSFLQLTDTPNSYAGQAGKVVTVNGAETGLEFTVPASAGARGFPSAQAVWLDMDAALQTPSGQPAFTTAQVAYNAADALATLSGLPVVIMVGKGSGVQFGAIALDGIDWNPLVSITGLGHGVSSIDAISTLSSTNLAGGDINITLNGCDLDQGIASFTLDPTGAFDSGDITISGNDSFIPTVYTATPAGGGNGGNVIISDGSTNIAGSILTNTTRVGKTSGSVSIGSDCRVGYIGSAATGGGNGGDVNLAAGSIVLNAIDAYADVGDGGDVTLSMSAHVNGSITSLSSNGNGGDVHFREGAGCTGQISVQSSSGGNSGSLTMDGNNFSGNVVASSVGGTAGTIIVQSGCKLGIIAMNTIGGTAGSLTATFSTIASVLAGATTSGLGGNLSFHGCLVTGPINVSAFNGAEPGDILFEGGTYAAVSLDGSSSVGQGTLTARECVISQVTGVADVTGTAALLTFVNAQVIFGTQVSATNGANGGIVDVYGGNYGNIGVSVMGGGTGGQMTIRNSHCNDLDGINDTANASMNCTLWDSTVQGIDLSAVGGANLGSLTMYASQCNNINASCNGGNGGLIRFFPGSSAEGVNITLVNGVNPSDLLARSTRFAFINASAQNTSQAAFVTLLNCEVFSGIDATGSGGANSGTVSMQASISQSIDVSNTVGTAGSVRINDGCSVGNVDASHVGGVKGSVYGENSAFASITCNSDGAGQSSDLNLFNCVVVGVIDCSADNGATTSNATIRSGAYGNIVFNATNASVSNQFNIFAADVGSVTGNNDGGGQAGFLTAASSHFEGVTLAGTTGAAGGFIQADNCKFGAVDCSGSPISGQIHMRNCRVDSILTSGSCNQKLDNCVIFGHILNAGFLSQFVKCSFQAQAATDCVDELTGDGAFFVDCSFQSDAGQNCIDASAPHTVKMYGTSLSRTDFSANVTASVGGLTIDPTF